MSRTHATFPLGYLSAWSLMLDVLCFFFDGDGKEASEDKIEQARESSAMFVDYSVLV